MRMRPHVNAGAHIKIGGAHVVQEHERPDRAALRRRNGASDGEAAQVAGARHDDGFDLAFACFGQGGHGVELRMNWPTAIVKKKANGHLKAHWPHQ
ncbi:hypothetical protein D3C73_1134420 [compost metagenome]